MGTAGGGLWKINENLWRGVAGGSEWLKIHRDPSEWWQELKKAYENPWRLVAGGGGGNCEIHVVDISKKD